MEQKINHLKSVMKTYPDFPKPGILFYDIFSILNNPTFSQELREVTTDYVKSRVSRFDLIVGLESRGFLVGTTLALDLGLPFVPVRKPRKLPGNVAHVTYTLEYGEDTLEIQKDSVKPGQRVLIVDDLLATGGSMTAACKLVTDLGAEVVGCFVWIGPVEWKGLTGIPCELHSLMQF